MSSEVLCLHRCLLASIPDSVHNLDSLPGSVNHMESNTDALLALLQKKQYRNALVALRHLRYVIYILIFLSNRKKPVISALAK